MSNEDDRTCRKGPDAGLVVDIYRTAGRAREPGMHASPRQRHERRGLSQRLNRLEFIVGVDGSSVFPHRGEKAVVNDASRV